MYNWHTMKIASINSFWWIFLMLNKTLLPFIIFSSWKKDTIWMTTTIIPAAKKKHTIYENEPAKEERRPGETESFQYFFYWTWIFVFLHWMCMLNLVVNVLVETFVEPRHLFTATRIFSSPKNERERKRKKNKNGKLLSKEYEEKSIIELMNVRHCEVRIWARDKIEKR